MTHTTLQFQKITMFGNDMLTVAVGLICLFGCVLYVLLIKLYYSGFLYLKEYSSPQSLHSSGKLS